MKIRLLEWEKYNPKRDQKNYTWFRMNNDIATDPDLFGLDAEQKLVWIVILSVASQKNTAVVTLDPDYLYHVTKVSLKKISKLLDFLLEKPLVERVGEHAVVSTTESGRTHDQIRLDEAVCTTPTNERTDETDGPAQELGSSAVVPEILVDLWNEQTPILPRVKEMSDRRRRAAAQRLNEKPDSEYWKSVIQRLTKSSFCCGAGERGWRANFDWFLRPDTHLKVLEGQYDDEKIESGTTPVDHNALWDEGPLVETP